MKRTSLILTLLLLASLLLAACGEQVTATSAPSTNVPMATSTSEMSATEAPTSATEATTSTPEANMTSTPAGIPVTGGTNPSQRLTSLMGSPVCGMAGDQLGTVQDMVLDFNQLVVTYMIVDANGKSVAVPYSFLIKPRTGATGTGTGAGTGSSGTGTQVTSTPAPGGTGALSTDTPAAGVAVSTATSTTGTGSSATSTPSTGVTVSTATSTTGTGSSSGTGNSATGTSTQQGCLTLSVANDLFNNAPAFDKSIMPGNGQSVQDWDTPIMDYWVSGGQPEATSTPAASGSTDTTGTATVTPGVQPIQGVFLASDLLNASVVLNSEGAGTGSSSGTGTGSSLGTSTPSAGGSGSTAVPDTTATASSGGTGTGTGSSTGSTTGDTSQGTVKDVIIDARIAKLQYLVVSVGNDNWTLVPVSLVGWDATNNQIALMTSDSMLQNAPSFSSSQFPDTSTNAWGEQFSSYWSGTGSGASTTATATP